MTFPFWGSYTFFQLERKKIQREVEQKLTAGMDKSKLVVLTFTKEQSRSGLIWKHSSEFVYKGEMYDIVEIQEDGDIIQYVCYKDNKETRLKSEKDKLISKAMGQDPARQNQSDQLNHFLKTIFSQETFSWAPMSPVSSTIQFSAFNMQFSSLSPTPLLPPPKYS